MLNLITSLLNSSVSIVISVILENRKMWGNVSKPNNKPCLFYYSSTVKTQKTNKDWTRNNGGPSLCRVLSFMRHLMSETCFVLTSVQCVCGNSGKAACVQRLCSQRKKSNRVELDLPNGMVSMVSMVMSVKRGARCLFAYQNSHFLDWL